MLYANDPDASAAWYYDLLGMEVVTRSEGFAGVFLSFGTRDHDIALFKAPGDGAMNHAELQHVAFELDGGLDDLKRFHARLGELGAAEAEARKVARVGLVPEAMRYTSTSVSFGSCFSVISEPNSAIRDTPGHSQASRTQRNTAWSNAARVSSTAGLDMTLTSGCSCTEGRNAYPHPIINFRV